MVSEPPGLPVPVGWTSDGSALSLLDQTLLPWEERYLRLETAEEVAEAIASLRVRGAPAIGIAAAMGLAMAFRRRWQALFGSPGVGAAPGDEKVAVHLPNEANAKLEAGFRTDRELLLGTRPTAVNLSWALERMTRASCEWGGEGMEHRVQALVREADSIAREDREMCRRIGEHGLQIIPREGGAVLTHCNAGALATGGMGTALAPVYAAHAEGRRVEVFADETRPLLQGARITAWELMTVGAPVTVITDSMAGALMKEGRVNLVLVGADRVAANGDVANKIGTYSLAVLARHHGIPFYVALPRTTFDPAAPGGGSIPIEARDSREVEGFDGRRTAPEGTMVWNPAFDVTPAHLVTAFITDGGLVRPPFRASIARVLTGAGPRGAAGTTPAAGARPGSEMEPAAGIGGGSRTSGSSIPASTDPEHPAPAPPPEEDPP
jgi:methylthioribose-1-phosphate isomerase